MPEMRGGCWSDRWRDSVKLTNHHESNKHSPLQIHRPLLETATQLFICLPNGVFLKVNSRSCSSRRLLFASETILRSFIKPLRIIHRHDH